MATIDQNVLDFITFPALSEIREPIRNELTRRFNAFGAENKPRTVWIRLTSNARATVDNPRKERERNDIFILMGAGTLDQERKLRAGFSNIYDYKRLSDIGVVGATGPELVKEDRLLRPTPGIESISITNMGEFGSIRRAVIQWWAPSVQDLDELSPYFLTPGITMLLEFGWGDLATQVKAVDVGKNENQLKENMVSFYQNPFQLFQKQCDSGGKYDTLIGNVSNFSWTVNDDGSFSCTTEITSMGELMAGISLIEQLNYTNPDEKEKQKKTIKEYITKDFDKNIESAREELSSTETRELGVIKSDVFIDDGVWWGLWGKETWVTWGFIEDIIINEHMKVVAENIDGFKPFELDSRGVLISNDPFLATTDPEVMLISKGQNAARGRVRPFDLSDDKYSGILRAIYVNVKKIKEIFDGSDTLQEALERLLNVIQVSGQNIWRFKLYVDPIREKMRIVDLNYVSKLAESINPKEVFSFGGFGGKSITKGLSLQTNLSREISIKFLYAINKATAENNSVLNDRNDVGLKTLYGKYRDLVLEKLRVESPNSDGSGQTGIGNVKSDTSEQNRGKAKLTIEELKDLIEEGTEIEVKGTNFVTLDSEAAQYLGQYLRRRTTENKRRHQNLFVPLQVEITIDGTSGIIPGNIFRLENIPRIYSDNGVFQVISVNHEIGPDNWDTTIRAYYRIIDIDIELTQKKTTKGIPRSPGITG